MDILVFSRLFWWFFSRLGAVPAVLVVFWLFLWFSASLGQSSGHFSDCVARFALFYPCWWFLGCFGLSLALLGHFCQFSAISVISILACFLPLPSRKRHQIDVYTLTIHHLLWDLIQAIHRCLEGFSFLSGLVPLVACCLLLQLGGHPGESSL